MNKFITRKRLKEKTIKENGLFVVKAGPGSGKTTCVAKRLAEKHVKWKYSNRGIVTISFTNVAWKKIEDILSKQFNINIPISYPHFLGTIDSFINQYIFLPFGHLVMGCNKRPELVGPPYNDWEPIGSGWRYWKNKECNSYCKLNNFSYDINDNLFDFSPKNHFNNCESNHRYCEKLKKEFNQDGYATQLDANYFALKILKKFPQIAKALNYRFPVLMIDEAQDTSEIQMKIVDLLIENGLKEVMLIGDPDQAIFEWRTAKPKLFEEKYKRWKYVNLKENYRSSQKICNFFSEISSFDISLEAANKEYKDFDFIPQIWEYCERQNQDEIIRKFLELCKDNKIDLNSKNIAILIRSRNFLQEIKGIRSKNNPLEPWNDRISKNIIRSRYLYDIGRYSDAFRTLERSICEIEKNKSFCSKQELESIINEYGFVQWRKEIYRIINFLPSTYKELQLGEWVKQSKEILENNISIISNSNFQLKIKGDRKPNKYSESHFDDIFAKKEARTDEKNYTIGTIHSVKGETFVAVLLFVRKNAGNSQKYSNVLKSKIEENEELRTIYVAITRPRKVLVIAVPKGEKVIWEDKFFKGIN